MTSLLARRVYDTCHLTGSFRVRSAQVSEEYFDKYLFEAQPALLREVAEAMVVAAGMRRAGRDGDGWHPHRDGGVPVDGAADSLCPQAGQVVRHWQGG